LGNTEQILVVVGLVMMSGALIIPGQHRSRYAEPVLHPQRPPEREAVALIRATETSDVPAVIAHLDQAIDHE
jgi:hypothetical protein